MKKRMKQENQAVQVEGAKRRRYSRVKIDCSAWLTVNNVREKVERVCDLSMGGVCILCQSTLEPGDMCDFELQDSNIAYHCTARVVWRTDDRLALEFVGMATDSYLFLQTMVLYHANDPLDVVEEFQEDFPRCR